MNSPRHPLSALLLCGLLFLIPNAPAQAGSATWSLNPTNGDWNTAVNWMPNTVPNGPSDTAIFGFSTMTNISTSDQTEVDSIVFSPGASAYTITLAPSEQEFLYISGTGIVNNSGVTQTFVSSDGGFFFHAFYFFNNATAGDLTVFYNPAVEATAWCKTTFLDSSNAGSSTITNGGGPAGFPGQTEFLNQSSAANATIINEGAPTGGVRGTTFFVEDTSAGTATLINNGGTGEGASGGYLELFENFTGGDATFINNGSSVEGAYGGVTDFWGGTMGNATLIANGTLPGLGAGRIVCTFLFTTSTARIELFGTGALDISNNSSLGRFIPVTVGSIEGDGLVLLGGNQLNVGSNDLSTVFTGVIGGNKGSLHKIGPSTLELTGANIFTGRTTIDGGELAVNNMTGSGTGTGPVQVNAARLNGRGTIAGPVTFGTGSGGPGAALGPGRRGGKPDSLTIQSALTFNADATYNCGLNTKSAIADHVVANGVTINGAQFSLLSRGGLALQAGTVLAVIDNIAATPIAGTFANLPDGSTFTAHGNTFQANYEGGDGNDLTLTVMPKH
jgi:autotransporter-associated beta strand protein